MLIRGGYMKKTISRKDKGYSLVELVVVLAIIVILAAMALVSVTIIHSARAKDAALQLDSNVAELIQKNKNMSPDATKDCKYGIVIFKEDRTSDPDYGKYKIGNVVTIRTSSNWYKYTKLDSGVYSEISDVNDIYFTDDPIVIPSSVDITFEGVSTSFKNGATDTKSAGFNPSILNGTGAICIMFDKRGNCISGYGEYKFYKKNGNQVSRVVINRNGSHEVK